MRPHRPPLPATSRGEGRTLSSRRRWSLAALGSSLLAAPAAAQSPAAPPAAVVAFEVVGDAIPAPLATRPGDAARGRAIVLDRARGNCLICHQVPAEPAERFQGELGPDLAGVGRRLTPAQLRLRLVDMSRLNPATIMPPYHRTEGLARVAPQLRGRPVFSGEEIEDIIAYLSSLR